MLSLGYINALWQSHLKARINREEKGVQRGEAQ